MFNQQYSTTAPRSPTPLISLTRFVCWDRKTGNALCFADAEITLPTGEKRLFSNLKLCQNGNLRPFLSEQQEGRGPNAARKLYVIEDIALRLQIEKALLKRYEQEKPGQLALFGELLPV